MIFKLQKLCLVGNNINSNILKQLFRQFNWFLYSLPVVDISVFQLCKNQTLSLMYRTVAEWSSGGSYVAMNNGRDVRLSLSRFGIGFRITEPTSLLRNLVTFPWHLTKLNSLNVSIVDQITFS